MQPTQAHPGHYWRTDDEAHLCFNEAGPEQPQTIRCYNMHDYINRGETREVPVSALEFLGAGIFGEARPSGLGPTTRWTGDSHRYGIYRNSSGLYRDGIVMLECHGGGMVGYAFDSKTAGETWERIVASFPPEIIWNLCNQIADAHRATQEAVRRRVYQAFVEGRLKKRRRHNQIYVELLAA
jgi:hypothetical protein